MKDFRSVFTSALMLACTLSLAACGASHPKARPDTGAQLPDIVRQAALQNCPQPAVVQQAQTVTLFLPGRTDIAAQIATVRMDGLSGSCTFNPKKKLLNVKFVVKFSAVNGPANENQPITLPWFVALTRGDQIIQEQRFQAKLAFDGNMSVATATSKPIKVEAPNDPASAGLEILLGIKMTPEQQAYQAAHPTAALLP